MEKRFARILAPLLIAASLASCVTTPTSGPASPEAQMSAPLRQAAALAQQEATLTGQARIDNAREIERLLAGVDDKTLSLDASRLAASDPLYSYVGRALMRRNLPLPHGFDRSAWKFDSRPPADADGYRPPIKLAVLLPLSGDLATAAAPVRDGLMAGYYGEKRRRPEVLFFDTAVTAGGALGAYNRAVAAGADFMVGPLGRDEVSALFQDENALSVPVLVLNRGATMPPPGNAAFSLAPEDDGLLAAEYLFDREHRKVLVISGSDDNGRRAAQYFSTRFTSRGGQISNTLTVGDAPGDLSAALATAAQDGVDGVFLAVKGGTARLLTPQLALAGLGGKTRIATSQLLSGTGKAQDDVALDGILFPTEVWTSRGLAGLPAASVTGERMNTARGPAARLFAFGYDAWLLTGYLEKLTGDNTRVQGATGTLQLDGFGNVSRTPAWTTFRGGVTVPVNPGS